MSEKIPIPEDNLDKIQTTEKTFKDIFSFILDTALKRGEGSKKVWGMFDLNPKSENEESVAVEANPNITIILPPNAGQLKNKIKKQDGIDPSLICTILFTYWDARGRLWAREYKMNSNADIYMFLEVEGGDGEVLAGTKEEGVDQLIGGVDKKIQSQKEEEKSGLPLLTEEEARLLCAKLKYFAKEPQG